MKTTSFKRIAFFSLLAVLAASCGGGGGGGGSSSNNYGTSNPITGPNANIEQNAVPLYNQIVNWKNNIQKYPVREGTLLGYYKRGYSKGIIDLTSQSGLPENCKEYLGGFIQLCSGQTQQQPVTAKSITERRCTREIYVNASNPRELRYANASAVSAMSCTASGAEAVYRIGNNAELNQLLSFQKGKIYQITAVSSGVYNIFVGPKGTFGNANHVYVIDTNIHSIYNPVRSQAYTFGGPQAIEAKMLFEVF